ncbi:hypothetical protein IJO12_00815 [bacterium]|nr:hypothetical protein [bacterium]
MEGHTMGIKTSIVGQPTDNHVTVEAKYKNGYTQYYYVNKDKADSFQKELPKNKNKQYWISTGMLVGAVATAITVPGWIIKDSTKKLFKIGAEIISGLALGMLTSRISYNINTKVNQKFLDKYDAKEIKMNSNN